VKDINELLSADEEFVRSTVWRGKGAPKLKNLKRVVSDFYNALHSADGAIRIKKATAAAELNPSQNEMMVFLRDLPEGPKWGRLKWGDKDKLGEGKGKKDRILQGFATLEELHEATFDELVNLFDDEVVGRSLYQFLNSEAGRDTIQRLRNVGVDLSSHQHSTVATTGPLAGKTVVVTGTLQRYSRDEAHELIRLHGGKPTSNVSKTTDYVVVGENPGSKVAKAKRLGVLTISEQEFGRLIGGT
jgi:hypothetical protein